MECIPSQALKSYVIEFLYIGKPATQYDRIRIEDRDQPAQTATKIIQKAIKRILAPDLTAPRLRYDLSHGQPLSVILKKGCFNTRTAYQRLDTTTVAAIAFRTVWNRRQVPPLTR
jgi:hypothetical protein